MKLEIELSEEQLKLIINALEVNFRLMMRQGNVVADLLSQIPDESKFDTDESYNRALHDYILRRNLSEQLLCLAANTLYDGSHVKTWITDSAHKLSDMWSVLRNFQYKLHASGDESDVRSCDPIQLSELELIRAKILEK